LLLFVHFDDTEGEALDKFSVNEDVYGINSGTWKLKTLKSYDEVAADKGDIIGNLYGHCSFDGHLVVDGISILIDDCDREFVVAGVFGSKAETHGEGALWVYDGSGLGGEGVEGSGDDHFSLIFSGEVAE